MYIKTNHGGRLNTQLPGHTTALNPGGLGGWEGSYAQASFSSRSESN